MKRLVMVLLIVLLASCTNSKGTIKFLEAQGYTDIKTTGFDFFAHGREDWSTTGFTAKNSNGKTVKGAVSDKGWSLFRPKMNIRIWSTK